MPGLRDFLAPLSEKMQTLLGGGGEGGWLAQLILFMPQDP